MVSSKAEGVRTPRRTGKYVEGFEDENDAGGHFQQPLKQEVALSHRQHCHWIACGYLPVGFHHIGFRVHVDAR